jgi:predicted PhzF superfamily epimerase YddE/YHI9
MNIKAAMKRSELFRGLDDEQLQQIATISHKRTFNSNETVFLHCQQGPGQRTTNQRKRYHTSQRLPGPRSVIW